jgi:hypothetical protein
MWKNLVHTQSNSDTIVRWSSITFFFIHPVYIRVLKRNHLQNYWITYLQHFAAKLCNFTNFNMLFLTVVMDFVVLA